MYITYLDYIPLTLPLGSFSLDLPSSLFFVFVCVCARAQAQVWRSEEGQLVGVRASLGPSETLCEKLEEAGCRPLTTPGRRPGAGYAGLRLDSGHGSRWRQP